MLPKIKINNVQNGVSVPWRPAPAHR